MNNAWSESYSRSTTTLHYSRNRHLCCVHTHVFAGFTSCVCISYFSVFFQVELCWILLFMVCLVTLTQWSMRSVTVLGFTMCFEVYQRLNHATMHVWKLSPQWRLEICVQTLTPPRNTKAAMILSRAMKPVAVGISRTHHLITTWVIQVRWHQYVLSYFPGKRSQLYLSYSNTNTHRSLLRILLSLCVFWDRCRM